MSPETVDDIIKLAPVIEPMLIAAAKGLMGLFEKLFPPKSGAKKAAAVIQATQTVAQQAEVAVPTNQQIEGIIAAELPGVLAEMANPPAVVPVETANQMVTKATAGMIPAVEHTAAVGALNDALAKSVPLEIANQMAVDAHAAGKITGNDEATTILQARHDLQTEAFQVTIDDLKGKLAKAQAAPAPINSATHGVTFLGSTPTLNER